MASRSWGREVGHDANVSNARRKWTQAKRSNLENPAKVACVESALEFLDRRIETLNVTDG